MNTPIAQMYAAGKERIPAVATIIANANNKLSQAMTSLNEQSARAGDPPLLKAMLEIGEQVYIGVHQTAVNMDNSAIALVATADDFVATDDRARQQYAAMDGHLKSEAVPTRHNLDPSINPTDWTTDGAPDGGYRDPQQKPTTIESTPDPGSSSADQQGRDGTTRTATTNNPVPDQPEA